MLSIRTSRLRGLVLAFALATLGSSAQAQTVPDWARKARVAGLSIQSGASASEVTQRVAERASEEVSVIELDTSLSHYATDTVFDGEVAFIDQVAQEAHLKGMKVVSYYPALEVVTPNGENLPSSMFKDHPTWLQAGIDGTPNVFFGSQEVWLQDGDESAWMSPNGPYRDYLAGRIEKLITQSAVDGIWLDVPIYLDTGSAWADTSTYGAAAYKAWSAALGYGGGLGLNPPTTVDFNNPEFRLWLRWRHENLADFLEDMRARAHAIDPDFLIVVEVYPMDYLDTVWTGLDAAYLERKDNFIRVWEVDSVSNTKAMQWSHREDFSSKLAMLKYARAIDRDLPSWSFSYGNQPLDAGLTLAATVATGNVPFESKTPIMTDTVSSSMRTRWYEFIRQNDTALLDSERLARAGVWFSATTREYQDMPAGGIYGMYLQSTPPTSDPDWWAKDPNQTFRRAPHLGGWRGAAHALHQLRVPYKAVSDPGDPVAELQGLELLWLPSVGSLSDAAATTIRDFVQAGGTVLATGLLPGTMDELGAPRSESGLRDLFGFGTGTTSGPRMQAFGEGVAIYRPDLAGLDLFAVEGGDPVLAESTLGKLEKLIRIHTRDDLVVDSNASVFCELSEASATEQHLYLVNYTGCQQPLISAPVDLPIRYRVPEGRRLVGARVKTPDVGGQEGELLFLEVADGVFELKLRVDQFALVTFDLADALPEAVVLPRLSFWTRERALAVNAGLKFVRTKMRDLSRPLPYRYGINTNLLDNDLSTEVYTGGHHVTTEHMGLFLRVAALLRSKPSFNEGFQFVRDVLYTPGYSILAWSMDKNRLSPFLELDALQEVPTWLTANAPIDDLRAIHGLLDGAKLEGYADAEKLARDALRGLYWTSVTGVERGAPSPFPGYAGGLIAYSFDWAHADDASLTPAAEASGLGRLGYEPLPIDYQDLETLTMAAEHDPRWRPVIRSALDLLLAAEIPGSPGLFYNGLEPGGIFTGDFEYPGERQGNNLKAIQELWIALHLKRISNAPPTVIDDERRALAAAAADRAYAFFKAFYQTHSRIPEYLGFDGLDVPDCGGAPPVGDCLERGVENLFDGEVRIYSQFVRLAVLFKDRVFARQVVEARILADHISDPADPRYGMFGLAAAGENDAEAWNTLEAVLTLCLEAKLKDPVTPNTAPVAQDDAIVALSDRARRLSLVELLGNDQDAEADRLGLAAVTATSAQGGTIVSTATGFVYTPPAGYLGADSFDYTVDDGRGGRATATVTVDVQDGGVAPPVGFVLDGDLGEWPSDASQGLDPLDMTDPLNLLDLRELYLTEDSEKFFLAYRTERPAALNYGYTIYFDTDQNSATGYPFWAIGADYAIQGNTLYRYAGTAGEWAWDFARSLESGQNGIFSELAVRKADLGSPAAFEYIFYGDDAAFGGPGIDYFPDSVAVAGRGLVYPPTGGNTAPVALSTSLSVETDSSLPLTLTASDAENDPLSYAIVTPPTNGSLSGTAPNLVYTPNAGYVGTDSFSFTAADFELTSAPATIDLLVDPAPPAAGIVIDGIFDDWAAVPSTDDPADQATGAALDLLALRLANDSSKLYVEYENNAPLTLAWGLSLYLDVDQKATSGFAYYDLGADYVLQGQNLFRYTGTGSDWSWAFVREVEFKVTGKRAELGLLRSDLQGLAPTIEWSFHGDNSAYGGAGIDQVPQNGAAKQYTLD